MAAEAAVSADDQFVTLARPAAGKTIAFLLLANYLLEVNKAVDVVAIICVEAGIIFDQCEEKIPFFTNKNRMLLVDDFNFRHWRSKFPKAFYIVDEGEQVIEQRLVHLKANEFHGLVCLADKKVFFYTATLDPYWSEAMKNIFGLSPSSIRQFPSIKYLLTQEEDVM